MRWLTWTVFSNRRVRPRVVWTITVANDALGNSLGHNIRYLPVADGRIRGAHRVDSLTPSELRIAQLAAGGLSNPEIAQQLFVTRKTVEAHLGHIYPKLDIKAREQLAAALGGEHPAAQPKS